MDLRNVPLLPEPLTKIFGSTEKALVFNDEWKIISNCKSERLTQHINDVFLNIQKNSSNFNYLYSINLDETPQSQVQVYPIGLISPRNPFFIIISPKAININHQVVIKTIKWKSEWNVKDYRSTDEYHLLISGFIQITARSERALFYGLKTLEQLFYSTGNQIAFQTIQDHPLLSLRAIHIDLKFFRPHQPFLLWQMKTLASYKINSVFIEWEDKFPFTGELEFIAHPAALTIEEKNELLKICSDYYLEAIPIIQSLGHYGYVLKHPNWRHLRESPKVIKKDYEMFCPSHPDTESAIIKIHNQIMDGMNDHRSSHFIHLGLDECYYIGECPTCSEKLGTDSETGKSKMFIDWLNKMALYYLKMGKRPIVWHDMLVRHPQLINKLDPQIIICDWEYEHPVPKKFPPFENIDPTGQTVDWVRTWEQKTLEMIQKNPPVTTPYFLDQCWKYKGGKYPLTAFPYTKYFRDQNFDVLCAPSTQYGSQTPAGPRYAIHIPNLIYANLAAIRNNAIGSLCTNWVVRETPWPLVQFGFLLHAETCWSGKIISEKDFVLKYWIHFHQMKITSNLEQILPHLEEYFSIAPIYGKSYLKFLKSMDEMGLDKSEYYTNEDILQKYPKYFEKLTPSLEKLGKQIVNNPDMFQFLLIYNKYWQFMSEWLPIACDIEKIAQSLDESGSCADRDIDQLNSLNSKLKNAHRQWNRLKEELKSVFTIYLHPLEIKPYSDRLITPLSDHIDLFEQSFPAFVDCLEQFIEKIMDSMIRRNQ